MANVSFMRLVNSPASLISSSTEDSIGFVYTEDSTGTSSVTKRYRECIVRGSSSSDSLRYIGRPIVNLVASASSSGAISNVSDDIGVGFVPLYENFQYITSSTGFSIGIVDSYSGSEGTFRGPGETYYKVVRNDTNHSITVTSGSSNLKTIFEASY